MNIRSIIGLNDLKCSVDLDLKIFQEYKDDIIYVVEYIKSHPMKNTLDEGDIGLLFKINKDIFKPTNKEDITRLEFYTNNYYQSRLRQVYYLINGTILDLKLSTANIVTNLEKKYYIWEILKYTGKV